MQAAANPVGRNSLYSKGLQQWDMNIQRSFKLKERVTLDFRGEMFNIFNHGNVDPNYMNNSLISGIPTDVYNDNGTNVFDNPAPAVFGHRHARIFVRISF